MKKETIKENVVEVAYNDTSHQDQRGGYKVRITYNYSEYPYSSRATKASVRKGVCEGTQGLISFLTCLFIQVIPFYLFDRVYRLWQEAKELVYSEIDKEITPKKINEPKLIQNVFFDLLKANIFYIIALPCAKIIAEIGSSIGNLYFNIIALAVYIILKVTNLIIEKHNS